MGTGNCMVWHTLEFISDYFRLL